MFPSDLMEVKDMDDRQRQQIRELREEGYGYGRIAQILEISENTIKTYCRRRSEDTRLNSSHLTGSRMPSSA